MLREIGKRVEHRWPGTPASAMLRLVASIGGAAVAGLVVFCVGCAGSDDKSNDGFSSGQGGADAPPTEQSTATPSPTETVQPAETATVPAPTVTQVSPPTQVQTPTTSAPAPGLEGTVALFYTLIDQGQFGPAYALLSSRFRSSSASFEAWQAGYATTAAVSVEYVRAVPGTASTVEVSILARDVINGRLVTTRYAGTWTLVQEQGAWRLDAANIQALPSSAGPPSPSNCSPAYPSVCIPPPPPDLDCGDIPYRRFPVLPPDPHGFDGLPGQPGEPDGIGCE